MRNRRITDAVCVTITAAAGIAILLSSGGMGPAVDSRLHSEIGRTLASETLSLLPAGGEIFVITRDTEAFPQPALDILLKSFEREVRRRDDIPVTVRSVPLDPLRPVKVPTGDFFELVRRARGNGVIVSVLGPPVLTPAEHRVLSATRPKVVAFCPGALPATVDLGGLLDSGLLRAAIIDRPLPSGGAGGFDQLYTVLRRDSAAARSPASLN